MEAINETILSFLQFLLYMIPGFIAIGIVIYLHELGHFFMARILGVNVEVMGYGFGPTIWSHQGKRTEFRISLIPFGGYCRLSGADDLTFALRNKDRELSHTEYGSIFSIHPLKKLLIYAAGPAINFVLALMLLFIVSAVPVERVSDEAILTPVADYPSLYGVDLRQKEIRKGDVALSSGGHVFLDYQDFSTFLARHEGEELPLTVLRDGKEINVTIYPLEHEGRKTFGLGNLKKTIIGRSEDEAFRQGDRIIKANGKPVEYNLDVYSLEANSYLFEIERDGSVTEVFVEGTSLPFAWESDLRVSPDSDTPFALAYERTITLMKTTGRAILKLLTFQLSEALENISGPFSSASSIGKITTLAFQTSSSNGLRTLLYLLSIVSVSICMGNLVPIPTFDGGQILVTLFEVVRGKTLMPRTYMAIHISGLVVAYMIIIVMNTYRPLAALLGL